MWAATAASRASKPRLFTSAILSLASFNAAAKAGLRAAGVVKRTSGKSATTSGGTPLGRMPRVIRSSRVSPSRPLS